MNFLDAFNEGENMLKMVQNRSQLFHIITIMVKAI